MHRRLRRFSTLAALPLALPAAAHAGTFADAGTYGGFAQPSGAAVLDVDVDGRADVVVADGVVAKVLHNTGGTGLAHGQALIATGAPYRVAAADLDGDSHADPLVLDADGAVRPFVSRIGGAQPRPATALPAGVWGTFATGDFNHDNKVDVVAGDDDGGQLAVLLGDGAGNLAAPLLSTPAAHVFALAAGSFGGDGVVDDVALVDAGTELDPDGVLLALYGKGDGTFTVGSPRALDDTPGGVAVIHGQVDGIAVALGDVQTFTTGLRGHGSVTTAAFNTLAFGDVDGDGYEDLVAPGLGGDGLWRVGAHLSGGEGYPWFTADDVPALVTADPEAPALGDIDGDGHLDAVIPEYEAGLVRVLRNMRTPVAHLSTTALSFSPGEPMTQRVYVRNDGDYVLTVGDAALGGPDVGRFGWFRSCGHLDQSATLRPGDSCSLAVSARRVGAKHLEWRATLTIDTSAGPQTVAITAPAVAGPPITPAIPPARCVVPKLKGFTLAAAKKKLAKANCKLGKVTKAKPAKHAAKQRRHVTLIVAKQTLRPGDRRKVGTPVGVRLEPKKAAKNKKKRPRATHR